MPRLLLTVSALGLLCSCAAERPVVAGIDRASVDQAAPVVASSMPVKQVDSMKRQGDVSPASTQDPKAEARGLWVSRWEFRSADDIRSILNDAKIAGFNQVYFQVRGEGDAYYRSSHEPWAQPLTGTLGKDPGWDPLGVALEEAHLLELELHAWVNVAAVWKSAKLLPDSDPPHLLRLHPEWRVQDDHGKTDVSPDGYVFVNLALPLVQEHVQRVLAELVRLYPVDGVHLDYCRYPAINTSFDRASRGLFSMAQKQDPTLTKELWQQRELTAFVAKLHQTLANQRPDLVLSAAVTGIYRGHEDWGDVKRGFDNFYQDSHQWAEQKVVDVLIPMIYWPPTNPPGQKTDFATLVSEFAPLAQQVGLYAGIKVEAADLETLKREIEIARQARLQGVMLFSWSGLNKNDWWMPLRESVFKDRAPPPAFHKTTRPTDSTARVP